MARVQRLFARLLSDSRTRRRSAAEGQPLGARGAGAPVERSGRCRNEASALDALGGRHITVVSTENADALSKLHGNRRDRDATSEPQSAPELAARAHLSAGRPDRAAHIVESLADPTSSTRLLTSVCHCLCARKAEAQLSLYSWARDHQCPTDARVLLALLQLDDGHTELAIENLQRNLDQIEDPRSIQLMIVIHLLAGRFGEAQSWAVTLRETAPAWTQQDDLANWLEALGFADVTTIEKPPARLIDHLALELIAYEASIPSLTVAQNLESDLTNAWLLIHAIKRALPDLEHPIIAIESLARLLLVVDEVDEARRWVQRGLAEHPLSAPLAMLLTEVGPAAGGRTENAPDPVEAIRLVAGAHPDWPDLQRLKTRLEAA